MKDPVQEPAGDWRQVFGALANEETRRYYAQRVLGIDSDLRPDRAAKARTNLAGAGLVDGRGEVDAGIFARILAAGAARTPETRYRAIPRRLRVASSAIPRTRRSA